MNQKDREELINQEIDKFSGIVRKNGFHSIIICAGEIDNAQNALICKLNGTKGMLIQALVQVLDANNELTSLIDEAETIQRLNSLLSKKKAK